jgi:hypothetical protein
MIVHSTTAQIITSNISSLEDPLPVSTGSRKVRVPELCDSEAIRNPISPLAIMAKPTSKAIKCGGLEGASSEG